MTPKSGFFLVLCTFLAGMHCANETQRFSFTSGHASHLRDRANSFFSINGNNVDRFGFFSSTLWDNYEGNLFEHIEIFSAVPRYVLWYIQMDEDFPAETIEFNSNLGIRTIVSHDLKSSHFNDTQNVQIVSEIVAGKWDKYFRSIARKARKLDGVLYYRFGYEMNGNWFPWCEQPKLFIEAWQHVWSLFHSEKATNVVWIFCPSILWNPGSDIHAIELYYPGDKYVDIVALDGYNFGDLHDKYHKWSTPQEIFSKSLTVLETFKKPIWIAETACPSDPRRAAWLNDFFSFVDSNKKIEVFIWFNEKKANEPDFRIQSDSASLLVFRDWLIRKSYEQQESGLLVENSKYLHK